jgi:Zn-dependent peptidase ImmA (M78 family)
MNAPIDLQAARLRADRRRAAVGRRTARVPSLSPSSAHFRSQRSVEAFERERVLAFAELVLAVFAAVEQQVNLPTPALPDLAVPADLPLTSADAVRLAGEARREMGLAAGPVPNMVRLLEAHGVAVLRLDQDDARGVDAFSHPGSQFGHRFEPPRPIVLLNPAKQDKARSRFDAAHELGHLLMQRNRNPGPLEPDSRWAEQQAQAFAAEFLAPAAEITDDLPTELDWPTLLSLKRRWGISLKTLVEQAHTLGRWTDRSYRRGLRQLNSWGLPERGALGPLEAPVLLARALGVLGGPDAVHGLALEAGLPVAEVQRIIHPDGANAHPSAADTADTAGSNHARPAVILALPCQA